MEWISRDKTSVLNAITSLSGLSEDELLHPKSDPFIYNIDKAAAFIKEHSDEDITIMGDYDSDGINALCIMSWLITEITGVSPRLRAPHRMTEGYGLSINVVNETEKGLLICVDNGIAAVSQIKAAKDKGLHVVIIDHHQPPADGILPDADVIVDPHAEELSEFDGYCGAALCYRLAKVMVPASKNLKFMEMAAGVATVTDVMTLKGDNRNIVKHSLDTMNQILEGEITAPDGWTQFLSAARVEHVTEEDYGFKIGPMLNAAGRLLDDGAQRAVELLSVINAVDGNSMFALQSEAEEFVELNKTRQQTVKTLNAQVDEFVVLNGMDSDDDCHAIVFYSDEMIEGLNGIIAGHLEERYHKPAVVFSKCLKDGIYKGSGRSDTVDLKKTLDKISDCILGYGGHAGAAGISIKADDFDRFSKAFNNAVPKPETDNDKIFYDMEIKAEDVESTISEVKKYAPYGEGVPAPVFRINNFELVPEGNDYCRYMGAEGQHVKLFGKYASAVCFDGADKYRDSKSHNLDILGTVGENVFGGKIMPQVQVVDFQPNTSADTQKNEVYDELAALLSF